MLLRRSGEKTDQAFHLEAITEADDESIGVQDEATLLEIVDAVFYADPVQLEKARERGLAVLGAVALVDAIGVAAAFNGITKIANATGIPLDESTEAQTVEMRQKTSIDEFSETHKSGCWD
ncbi:MAG: hypothetical protein ACI9ON_004411 [Limisphaerales bacterium]|jgi:hypothetical protein